MNNKSQTEWFIGVVCIFLIGGIIGMASLPAFPGRFFVSGVVLSVIAVGGFSIIIKR
ncbi:MAG: hypothetical protein PHN56_01445 [Candidatus Nanoarchaeia archaeon]|nr:hypothetical protein [Candidatus Nanoarchaeia archaeon]